MNDGKKPYDCVIVDYGMGNLHSAYKALKKVSTGLNVGLSSDPTDIVNATKIVLPGVGAIYQCMTGLRKRALDEAVNLAAKKGRMILAVCIGMQLLFEHSEENDGVDCLGLFPGRLQKFPTNETLKVPHMGWNRIKQNPHVLWNGIEDNSYFYFVHSYYASIDSATMGVAEHGLEFSAAVGHENIFATQFHPEKSDVAGLRLLRNFLDWNC